MKKAFRSKANKARFLRPERAGQFIGPFVLLMLFRPRVNSRETCSIDRS